MKKIFGKLLLWSGLSLVSLIAGLSAAELALRLTEKEWPKGAVGSVAVPHPTLGWTPTRGKSWSISAEFAIENNVNEADLSEQKPLVLGAPGCDVLAVGDSHTFASGVGTDESWPNVTEALLAKTSGGNLEVWNAGVPGYSVGQYLLSVRRLMPLVRPKIVLVGFSTATDFYDVVPRGKGGFVYYDQFGRTYFDLDANGQLSEHHELDGVNLLTNEASTASTASTASIPLFQRARIWLGTNSRLYPRFKSSSFAVWLASKSTDQRSIWPSMDTAFKRTFDTQDQYRFDLVLKILTQLRQEAQTAGARVVLVKIPYLPEVYDEIWTNSFGLYPKLYDRKLGSLRAKAIADAAGMEFVDTTNAFANAVRQRGHWLHHKMDRHPTAEGQQLIAERVVALLQEQAEACGASK